MHVLENVPLTPRPAKEAFLDGPEDKDGSSGARDPAEEKLLEGCRGGDVAAFERLYELHGARMKSIARNLLGHETDAEDAVQEAFLKIYRGAASFRGSAALSTWIYRILVNTCYDLLRRRKRHPEDPIEAPSGAGDGSALPAPAGDHPLRMAIEQSLSKLAPRQRTVFLLSAVEGFSHREIAGVLDVSEGASRTLLFEAKRRLQDLLWTSGARGRASA
ncbi:MAG: RNA polymerase sigma factor [Acidobacteria bacterium]|nr:RNA polymerase sigma factor [Acidobacteriota bacterium]MCA1609667.1 RNA polymerase sigma factor [Acidobacteriota bacterium]